MTSLIDRKSDRQDEPTRTAGIFHIPVGKTFGCGPGAARDGERRPRRREADELDARLLGGADNPRA
jgi:hypothetical protein